MAPYKKRFKLDNYEEVEGVVRKKGNNEEVITLEKLKQMVDRSTHILGFAENMRDQFFPGESLK